MKLTITYAILIITLSVTAQTGTIKGRVIDQQSGLPIPGVTIELLNQEAAKGVITNQNGYYTLDEVPLGRQAIRFSFLGYETITNGNIVVTTGKDARANAQLIEAFGQLDEVVLTSSRRKDRPINKLATVSARQFGVEEVQRFSGGRGDVGRLAANFAGVSAPDDSRNDIVVRGNSPTGLLWRLEGIPIPSPNHFATAGTTGGPVSALNPNMLENSDFFTSAFPAEYGNAIGGVFDLGFRKGNKDDYEYTVQAGAFTGLEAIAEGPVGKKNGSFLIAGRYSLIGLIGAGAGTAATPNYSDVSFNLDFGDRKLGNFSIFGIIGNSDIEFLGEDIDEDDLFAAEDENAFVNSGFAVFGLRHQIGIGKSSYVRTILSYANSSDEFEADRFINFDTPEERTIRYTEVDNAENRIALSTMFNSKLSNKATLRTGVVFERFNSEQLSRDREEQPDLNGDGDPDLTTFINIDESLSIIQPYVQGQFRLSEKLTLNAGLHSQYSDLNEQFVLEPRAGLSYKFNNTHKISIGYGLHHQLVPLPILFLNETVNGTVQQTNADLDFTRSSHYVLGYDVDMGKGWRAKLEAYYQDIDNAGVEPFPSSYSTLTEGADFGFSNDRVSLVNEGTGFNQGVEFTLEKFFSDGYYGLLTTSIFESKYEGSDSVERNSPFNNGYVANLLAGKEFKIGKVKKNTFFVDTRLTIAGGRYETPVDLQASQDAGFEVLQEDLAFSEQIDDYMRWDVKFGFQFNSAKKKTTHRFYVDLQNVTNNDNVFQRRYNRLTNEINQVDQIGFFPDVGYRFTF
ncbi:TonB-dependent receptor [Aquimarina sp. U1-2]|uniref:TonB-dependent receptor n=1 Tax=Aquimarina sp. U1-2 TaxID=2823141 RepID=UPI001AECA31C|nr:TonB-dependent receptor [Aquimarina sp. U1-2]MBP2831517.1 TonB-dependent receptor [Aquimarina sp. U1-2]